MKIFSEDGLCFIDMEHSLTVDDVVQLKEELIPLFETNNEFMLHCVDVVNVDSAGLQSLISLKKYLQVKEKQFNVTTGKKLKDVISLFMLEKYFEGVVI